MTDQQHDWNRILLEEGDAPLAPSCMRYLDISLDMNATLKKFWDTLDNHYQKRGYADTRNRAYKASGLCDAATLNLIATHYGQALSLNQIDSILLERNSVRDIRLLTLMRIAVYGPERHLSNALTSLINANFAELKKYPLGTDEGFASQKALTTLLTGIFSIPDRMIKHRVLGGELPSGHAWFTDEALAVYTLENPDKVDDILRVIYERKAGNASVIRDVLATDSRAMSAGVL